MAERLGAQSVKRRPPARVLAPGSWDPAGSLLSSPSAEITVRSAFKSGSRSGGGEERPARKSWSHREPPGGGQGSLGWWPEGPCAEGAPEDPLAVSWSLAPTSPPSGTHVCLHTGPKGLRAGTSRASHGQMPTRRGLGQERLVGLTLWHI